MCQNDLTINEASQLCTQRYMLQRSTEHSPLMQACHIRQAFRLYILSECNIILCKSFSILCACKKFMCCEELFWKRPVPTKILVIAYSCDDLLRKLQRGVCIFSFSFFYHLCGSYYVHSNIVNIKGSIHACFLNFHVSITSLPSLFLSDLLLNSLGVWLSAHNPSSWVSKNTCVFCFLSCLLSFHLSFVWNYSYYTSTELLARYKCMPISLFTPNFLPNVFRKQYVLLVYRSLLTCPPSYCVCKAGSTTMHSTC